MQRFRNPDIETSSEDDMSALFQAVRGLPMDVCISPSSGRVQIVCDKSQRLRVVEVLLAVRDRTDIIIH